MPRLARHDAEVLKPSRSLHRTEVTLATVDDAASPVAMTGRPTSSPHEPASQHCRADRSPCSAFWLSSHRDPIDLLVQCPEIRLGELIGLIEAVSHAFRKASSRISTRVISALMPATSPSSLEFSAHGHLRDDAFDNAHSPATRSDLLARENATDPTVSSVMHQYTTGSWSQIACTRRAASIVLGKMMTRLTETDRRLSAVRPVNANGTQINNLRLFVIHSIELTKFARPLRLRPKITLASVTRRRNTAPCIDAADSTIQPHRRSRGSRRSDCDHRTASSSRRR